jgi:hypothetical protein
VVGCVDGAAQTDQMMLSWRPRRPLDANSRPDGGPLSVYVGRPSSNAYCDTDAAPDELGQLTIYVLLGLAVLAGLQTVWGLWQDRRVSADEDEL